jgi:hypothetical protein
VLVGFAANALAVCLDPRDPTGTKYYYPSLEEETRASAAIVVARLVHTEPVSEDKSDPEGWTAFIYILQVAEVLKGKVPRNFILRVENDSGGYRMQDGEIHLLFLSKGDAGLSVDPCGNSAEMPKGEETVKRVRAIIITQQHVG